MSVAIPNVLLTVHIGRCYGTWFELVMVMGLRNVASLCFALEVGDWTMVKEMPNLFTDLAPIVLFSIGHCKTRHAVIESS